MKEFIVKLQLALFFTNPVLRPDTLMNRLDDSMENIFNAMPQILPIPQEVPHDIPRVQMRSIDNKYHCQIAPARIDFIINGNNANEQQWSALISDFKKKIRLFINFVLRETNIIRFGIIGNFIIPDKSASATLTKKYLKINLNSAEEINLRFNKRSQNNGLELNNITSINVVFANITQDISDKSLFIELDINNIPTKELDIDTLNKVFDNILPKFSIEKVKELLK